MRFIFKLGQCLCVIVLLVVAGTSQSKPRLLVSPVLYQDQPIVIVGREVAGEPFKENEKIIADEDWLKQLVLEVKNVSSKNIKSFDIDLVIKDRGLPVLAFPINFRTYTKPNTSDALTTNGEAKVGVLQPGESVKVKITAHSFEVFTNELKKRNLENVERATIEFRFVYFDDGTNWAFGKQSRIPQM